MTSKSGHITAALAEVDNQKNAETCTLLAMSKAVCNGFETEKFFPCYLDFDQGQTKTALFGQINDFVSIRIILCTAGIFNASSS